MLGSRPSSFPMEQHSHLLPDNGAPLPDPSIYRRLVGRLLYLTVTRPYIQYFVNTLNQFMKSPCSAHLDATNRVLCYLKGSIRKGLLLSASSFISFTGYVDSDWARCPLTPCSTTKYFTMLGSSPISWKTKKQPTVSCSSTEAEYRSLVALTVELQWLRSLPHDLGFSPPHPIPIHCDNQAAIHIT